ncbi:MAG: ADP-ribosylglycohydrolase family protein [archaeon]|nr:ADP-ribosylglycohydrolase family protein [archaeon]
MAVDFDSILSRSIGCLAGVAIGDAMGMPTFGFSPDQIREKFGKVVNFIDAPIGHIIHDGLKTGQVTDDTQITLILADAIIRDGFVSKEGFAKRLLEWSKGLGASIDKILGPSTRRALEKIAKGARLQDVTEIGTTDGASMRISPVGILNAGFDLEKVVEDVVRACVLTHNTSVAISAASSVAYAISKAIVGKCGVNDIIKAGIRGSRLGAKFGIFYSAAPVDKRIELAIKLVSEAKNFEEITDSLYNYVGAGIESNEAIPTAFGVFFATNGEPMDAIIMATNIGGDSDTIASIVGGMAGAYKGIEAFPKDLVKKVEQVNGLEFEKTARKLLELREKRLMK